MPATAAVGSPVTLSAWGADDGGEPALDYLWSVAAKPAGAADPTFSGNGTNATKNTTATFAATAIQGPSGSLLASARRL